MSYAPLIAMGGSLLFDKIFGGRDDMKKVPTMTSKQQSLLNQILEMVGSGPLKQGYGQSLDLLRQYMDPSSEAVKQFTDPYVRQFNQETIPNLAERFAGMGAMGGGLSSSGFGQSLGAAGAGLQSQLAAMRAGLGQQAAQSLMSQYGGMMQTGLSAQPFAYQQSAPGMAGGVLQGWAQSGFPGPWGSSSQAAKPLGIPGG